MSLRGSSSTISPLRMRSPSGDFYEANVLYQTAQNKLYEVAWKFDREKNGDIMRTLENRELTKEQFKFILRSSLNCKLSNDEFDAFIPRFDNNGVMLSKRLQKEKRLRDANVVTAELRLTELEKKNEIQLIEDYTDGDLQSAMNKITEAAVKYDRLMPGAVQLDAFECEYMPPNVFREQLRHVFNIQLTIPELTAFIRDFNEDKTSENIYCTPFLVKFFRLGFKEKQRRLREVWETKKRIEEEKEKKKKEEKILLDKKNSTKCDFNYSPEDKERAVVKLRNAAKLYDKSTPGASSMKGFEVQFMPAHVFKEQLKRVFNLQVNAKEMGALMDVFDVNRDGFVTCEEFSKVFLNMGFAERARELKEVTDKQRRFEEFRRAEEERKKQELAKKNALKVSYEYTEDEYNSAMYKLVEAAWKYDKTMPGSPSLEAFEIKDMEPHEFKEQFQQAFLVKFTPAELGAIVDYFDTEKVGKVNCAKFLKKFFKTGNDERERRHKVWRAHQQRLIEKDKKKKQEKAMELDSKMSIDPKTVEYTENDFQSAFSKLTEGAIKYSRTAPGAIPLDAFEAITMPAHVFKEQLKLIFNIKVTLPELSALISYFNSGNSNNSGELVCKDFVNKFLRTGIEERHNIQRGWREQQKKNAEKAKLIVIEKEDDKQKKAWAEVDFEFSEEDFNNALWILINMCHHFDPRQLGPAGWKAFQCESMNPAEFRECIKRTFNVKLTSQELGVWVQYFDTDKIKVANCTAFMNTFVQIRVKCEEFKGKSDEKKLLKNYHEELKASYESKMERLASRDKDSDLKPWRQNAVVKTLGTQTVKKIHREKPKTPWEKFKLRIAVAKVSKKLDLSSRKVWDVETDDASIGNSDSQDKINGIELIFPCKTVYDDNKVETDGLKVDVNAPSSNNSYERSIDEENNAVFAAVSHPASPTHAAQAIKKADSIDSLEVPIIVDLSFKLNCIPASVLKLTDLTELWLSNNSISEIPSQIADMKQLQLLSLTNNKLDHITPEICLLENLQKLYLNNNMISSLPNLFGKLRLLTELDISYNSFAIFPEVLTTLPRLVHLYMSDNKVKVLPNSFFKLRSLIFINLENNNFSKPPDVLGKTSWLEVKGCPIPVSNNASDEFIVTFDEEQELLGLLKSRANGKIAAKLRRRKKKSSF